MTAVNRFGVLAILVLIWVYPAELVAQARDFGPRSFDQQRDWIAIVTAYAPEVEAIDKALEQNPKAKIDRAVTFRGVEYQLGQYQNKHIVVFTTGVSVTNAAMTMQMALDYFPIGKVLMMGIAGAVADGYQPGDLAVPARWFYHDESVYANPSPAAPGQFILPDYYQLGEAERQARRKQDAHSQAYRNFGYVFPNDVRVRSGNHAKAITKSHFKVSESLLEAARKVVSKQPDISMPSGRQVKVHVGGNGTTGSVFLDNGLYRLWLNQNFAAQVVDMESAAVGQVCYANNIDWLVVRSVSDQAGKQLGKNTESVFDGVASGTAAKFVMQLLDEMP